jgi:hypothetical protein
MSYKDPITLLQKSLVLIDRHLDQLLEGGPVAQGSAITIQNYAKTLVVVAKELRDQISGSNPAELTDEELETLAAQAAKSLNMEPDNAASNQTSGPLRS